MQSACIGRDEQTRQGIVLVIEDDASVGACLVEAITQETPYIAFLVTEAQHALTILKEVKPNIILLDYMLPQMNGIDLYDYLHAHRPLKNIPVIMISANLPQKEINRRHIIGLQKPFEIDDLLTTLKELLMDKEAIT
ncbi:MAG TPA: response regulator [Ktedonobacteraceae bacterium]